MANETAKTVNKRVQINITLTVHTNADAVALIDWADELKTRYPDAVVESRIMDQGSRLLGIP